MGTEVNAQNQLIMDRLASTQAAVQQLVEAGLTVTNVDIESASPRIDLMSKPRPRLPTTWKVYRRGRQGLQTEYGASVNGCDVRWTEE